MVVAYTAAETIWIKQLLAGIGKFRRRPVTVYCDNVSATYLTANPVHHDRSKHIDVDYHFVREMLAKGGLIVRRVPTQSQVADSFTKGLSTDLFTKRRFNLSVISPSNDSGGVLE